MGLFDYVRCEPPLPDGYDGELQTKDFDEPYMLTHVITLAGRLMQCVLLGVEEVPTSGRPYPNGEGILEWVGSQRNVTEMRDTNYHGMFSFGGLETVGYEPHERYGPRGRPIYKYHGYVAKFTDGQLIEISVEPE